MLPSAQVSVVHPIKSSLKYSHSYKSAQYLFQQNIIQYRRKLLTCFIVQVVILKVNSSQSLLISFAYLATPSSKESFQLFKVGVAIFSEGGKWYQYRDCRLVRVRNVYLSFSTRLLFSTRLDIYLRLQGSGPVLALNREDL